MLAASVDLCFKQLEFLSDDVASVKEVLLMQREEHHKEQAPSTEKSRQKKKMRMAPGCFGWFRH